MNWLIFWCGLGLGVLITVPVAVWAARRTEKRVRRLEQRARAHERLAELGTMTSGLAHEIKNPLSTIGLHLQLLGEDLSEIETALKRSHPPDQQRIDAMRRRFLGLDRETQRLRRILEDFLRFAGRVKLQKQPTNLNDLVDELVDFFHPQAVSQGVTVRSQLKADPAVAMVDPGQLKQAVLNLMINAAQIMAKVRDTDRPHGGANELILTTDRVVVGPAPEIRIHIIDTGPGIDTAHQDKIFQPYFSTQRGGTGLGLPTSRRIVEEHGGHLTFHTDDGRGTDFVIALPAVDRAAAISNGQEVSDE